MIERSRTNIYIRVLLILVSTVVTIVLTVGVVYKSNVLHNGILMLNRRLWMGGIVSPNLHPKDTIYKHAAVATDNNICSTIGKDTLMKNGSAVDAAIASLLCLGVMNAHSTGIGGGGFMIVYTRKDHSSKVIDFRETAPGKAHKNLFRGDATKGITGGLAVAVPGELRGMQLAHKKYGKLPWKELFKPAINLCNKGFEITESLGIALKKWRDNVLKEKCLRRIYVREDKVLSKGDWITNKPLGKTLKRIADYGNADIFYTGKMAKQFVREVKQQNGIITEEDLRNYKAIEREPLISRLGEFTMLNVPPPASGPVLAFILNILKGYNMTERDFKIKDGLVYHRMLEAFNFAYAKRTELADPDFEKGTLDVVKELMDEQFAEKTRLKIDDSRTHDTSYYGGKYYVPITTGTTHMVVIDASGDAVGITSTVNGYLGAKFRSCTMGFIYNNEMDDFSVPGLANEFGLPPSEKNFIKPYKRPLSSSVPVIILDKQMNVRLVAGGSGGSIITTAVSQVIMNNLWFGMSPKDSIQQPRVHSQLIPNNTFAEMRVPEKLLSALRKKGHNITVTDGSHAVVQGIARVDDEWPNVCKKGSIENTDFANFCLKNSNQNRVAYFAESDYRKGGMPAGY